jgi:hypothetical protein
MTTADSAKKIWAAAQPVAGTLTEKYLGSRGIELPSPVPKHLRFAPKLTHPNEQYFPGLVALVTHAKTGAEMGIQRTFLAWSGTSKAQVEKNQQKLSLGPVRGGVVRLGEPQEGAPLLIGEGLETVLTVIQATGSPGWATLGTAGLASLELPDTVKDVIFLAENDGGPNQKALDKACPALVARGMRLRIARPPVGLKDFNDLINGKSGHMPAAGLAVVKEAVASALEFGAKSEQRGATAKEPKRRSQASNLADLAKSQCEFFHDSHGETYASFRIASHRETHKLKARSFQLWLRRIYYLNQKSAPSSEAVRAALALLESFALFDGSIREVFIRRAAVDGKVYVDLCDDLWRAVEIDESGWRVIDEPPVRFRRAPGMLRLPEPARCDPKQGLDRLRDLLWIKSEEDFILIVAWLLAALAGRSPYTILFFLGEPGATKTTAVRVLRMLIDPNDAPSRRPPRDARDFYIAANRGCVIVCNNVSSMPDWLSDELCVITEGSGDARRELYTDEDESIIHACVPAIVTAIENVIMRGDAVQRTLFARLDHVPEESRKDDAEFFAEVEVARPAILGALCGAISGGLHRERSLKLPRLPRMAAFAKWGAACEQAFWDEGAFMSAYRANRDSAVEDVIEGDKVVAVLRAFMTERGQWQGTATELLSGLVKYVKQPQIEAEATYECEKAKKSSAQEKAEARWREARARTRETLGEGWPKAPHKLVGRLKLAGDALRKAGVHIRWPSHHGKRKVIVIASEPSAKENTEESQESQASPSNDGFNDNDSLEDDPWDTPGCSWDALGTLRDPSWTLAGRSTENAASQDNHLEIKADTPVSGAGDAWDANSRKPECASFHRHVKAKDES